MRRPWMVPILSFALCEVVNAQPPAGESAPPTAQAIVDAVGASAADVFVRFGPPTGGLLVGDTTTKPPTVIVDYVAFRFRVQSRQVVRAEFRSRWKEGTVGDVRLLDTSAQVTGKLGPATEVIKNPDGTERHEWTDREHHRVTRVLFDKEHRCIGVYVIPEMVAAASPDAKPQPTTAGPSEQPPAQAVIDAVGGTLADTFTRFGTPQEGLEAVTGDSPSVRMNYPAFAFKVQENTVVGAEFRVYWKGDIVGGVRMFDALEAVEKKLGPASFVTKATDAQGAKSERHNWVDEQKHRVTRVLFLESQGCVRVVVERHDAAR